MTAKEIFSLTAKEILRLFFPTSNEVTVVTKLKAKDFETTSVPGKK